MERSGVFTVFDWQGHICHLAVLDLAGSILCPGNIASCLYLFTTRVRVWNSIFLLLQVCSSFASSSSMIGTIFSLGGAFLWFCDIS